VPTFVELGHPELDYANWFGVVVSSKVPPQVADRLHRAIEKAADAQAVRDRIVDLGFEVVPSQGIGQLAQSVRTDYERNAAIVKKFNITP
jgi:tripartite-type tricarboxylate transporter receptor subunit TctC